MQYTQYKPPGVHAFDIDGHPSKEKLKNVVTTVIICGRLVPGVTAYKRIYFMNLLSNRC